MPAVVISTEVSQSGGTSEPLGSRVCPFSTKYSTKRRRISWLRIPPSYRSAPVRPPALRLPETGGAGYRECMHEDDTLRRFENSEPYTGRVEPLDEYVLIEPVDGETQTGGGLIIPSSDDASCTSGIVVAAGEEAIGITPGDKVLFPRDAGYEIRLSGQPMRLVSRHELIARLHD